MALKATAIAIIATGLAGLALPAQAETSVKSQDAAKPVTSKTTYWRKTAVAPIPPNDDASLVLVVNDEGQRFYNHVRRGKHLAKIRTDVDVVETYTITHEGRTYTNKITKDDK